MAARENINVNVDVFHKMGITIQKAEKYTSVSQDWYSEDDANTHIAFATIYTVFEQPLSFLPPISFYKIRDSVFERLHSHLRNNISGYPSYISRSPTDLKERTFQLASPPPCAAPPKIHRCLLSSHDKRTVGPGTSVHRVASPTSCGSPDRPCPNT